MGVSVSCVQLEVLDAADATRRIAAQDVGMYSYVCMHVCCLCRG